MIAVQLTATSIVLACALIAVAAHADTLPTARDILAEAATAAGTAPGNFRQIVITTGKADQPSTKTTTYQMGNDQRVTVDRGDFHTEAGIYHGFRWQQDVNGLTTAISSNPDPDATPAPLATPEVSHVTQPIDAYVLTLHSSGITTRYFFASTSHLLVQKESIIGNVTSTIANDVFATFGSQTLPKHWTITSSDKRITPVAGERVELVANAVADADVRDTPTRRALVEFPPGDHAVDLPVTFDHNAIYVRATMGSRTVDLQLSSTTPTLELDPDFAAELGFPITDEPGDLPGGQRLARLPELHVGPLVLHDIAIRVRNELPVHPYTIKPRGILGFDFLAQLGLTIDYQAHTVHVVPAEDYVPPGAPGTIVLPVRIENGAPVVTVRIGDAAVAYHVVIGTAFSSQLGFSSAFKQKHPDLFSTSNGTYSGYSPAGPLLAPTYAFPIIDVGPMRFRDFVAILLPSSSLEKADGVIGSYMLSLFTVGLDYTRGRIYLTKNAFGNHATTRQR